MSLPGKEVFNRLEKVLSFDTLRWETETIEVSGKPIIVYSLPNPYHERFPEEFFLVCEDDDLRKKLIRCWETMTKNACDLDRHICMLERCYVFEGCVKNLIENYDVKFREMYYTNFTEDEELINIWEDFTQEFYDVCGFNFCKKTGNKTFYSSIGDLEKEMRKRKYLRIIHNSPRIKLDYKKIRSHRRRQALKHH